MNTEIVIIIVLCGAVLLLFLLLVLVLARRSGGAVNTSSLFLSISQRLDELGRVSDRLQELSHILFAPQSRGAIGETMLEELLKNMLPKGSYEFQHQFSNGARVDALIKIGNNFIPVDAKFPLKAFGERWGTSVDDKGFDGELRRAFLKYMAEISEKYIRPQENTSHFALMYIPAEAVFYEGFVKYQNNREKDLFTEALALRVIPVSPSGLFLYLQTIAFGVKSFELDRHYDELIRIIAQLKTEFSGFARLFSTVGTHLKNMNKAYDEAAGKCNRLEVAVERLESPGRKNIPRG
jgi:DNA recombination protein RmuC